MKIKKKVLLFLGLFMACVLTHSSANVWQDEVQFPCKIVYLGANGGLVTAAGTVEYCILSPWSVCFENSCEPIVIGHPDL